MTRRPARPRTRLAVSVRSGGHSWAAWSLRDDALLIDLGALTGVELRRRPPGSSTAGPAAQGGRDLAPFLAERGRAFPVGHCPGVGLGGYLLQGGQGWNGRSDGLGVRERGGGRRGHRRRRPRARRRRRSNSDLYWAARGAGPGFPGIVTRFHLRTYPAAAAHVARHLDVPARRRRRPAALAARVLPTLDRRVEPVLAATRLPGVPLHPGVGAPGHGAAAAHHGDGRLRRRGRGPAAASSTTGRSPAGNSATCADRPQWTRRASPRPRRARTATGTRSTARGPTRPPTSSRRC